MRITTLMLPMTSTMTTLHSTRTTNMGTPRHRQRLVGHGGRQPQKRNSARRPEALVKSQRIMRQLLCRPHSSRETRAVYTLRRWAPRRTIATCNFESGRCVLAVRRARDDGRQGLLGAAPLSGSGSGLGSLGSILEHGE